jgi:hypothetical protein
MRQYDKNKTVSPLSPSGEILLGISLLGVALFSAYEGVQGYRHQQPLSERVSRGDAVYFSLHPSAPRISFGPMS